MILLFKSKHCIWCDLVRDMLQEELVSLGIQVTVVEVDIERQEVFSEVYGVRMVPTLMSTAHTLCGLPSESDLRSLLLRESTGDASLEPDGASSFLSSAMQLRREKPHVASSVSKEREMPVLSLTTEKQMECSADRLSGSPLLRTRCMDTESS
ncbi:MAG: thioredoxin family protein [Candidatus Thorarchaeota archaeon]|nr:thioredoxin family protein [Candidatus Thorarchaeota archaeon]